MHMREYTNEQSSASSALATSLSDDFRSLLATLEIYLRHCLQILFSYFCYFTVVCDVVVVVVAQHT